MKENQEKLSDMKFICKYINFGKVSRDTLLVGRYAFFNSGKDSLRIKYVNPDCSCASYKLSQKTLSPGDTAYIELVFKTKDKLGVNKIYTTVCANTNTKMYKLTLKANVLEDKIK